MTGYGNDPCRRCLKTESWPSLDQEMWSRATQPQADILDEPGVASHWRPATRHKNRRGYGRWLNFLETNASQWLARHPAKRITVDTVRQYLLRLEGQRLAPYSIVARLAELHAVISVFAPDEDWNWLWQTVERFRYRARLGSNKNSRLLPSSELFAWGQDYMAEIEAADTSDTIRMASRFRDGLMIALLAARPLRRSNLVMIEIDRHLIQRGEQWHLIFGAEEVKNHRPLEMAIPDKLVTALERYLSHWRPMLLQDKPTNRLWLTQYGKPMTGDSAYRRITKVTLRAFGTRLSPHLFRNCAATSIAIEDPDHVRIAPTILGHTKLSTTENHYIQANSLEAGRKFQKTLAALRREIAEQNPQQT